MTEAQIEGAVSRKTDGLDQRFLATAMTQAEYDAGIKAIDGWANAERAKARAIPVGWQEVEA